MARIRTNLVIGFLGVGKTTLVRHLLQQRPAGERWAVLVNEFGEIGIDGILLEEDGVTIAEVAGGCLCCVSAPAFTTGLNRLIRSARPDRILIEPSGLGHPARVIGQLTAPPYDSVLDVQATVCVMDARHLSSPRHREHPVFSDQLHQADVLVANKSDTYTDADHAALEAWLREPGNARARVALAEQGRMDAAWLDSGRALGRRAAFPEAHAFLLDAGIAEQDQEQTAPWLMIPGAGDGYARCGWLIAPDLVFAHAALLAWLDGLDCERVKGVFRTDAGGLGYNRAGAERRLDGSRGTDSRLTLIHAGRLACDALDAGLRACLA